MISHRITGQMGLGSQAIHILCASSDTGFAVVDSVQALLQYKASVDSTNPETGATPLMRAAGSGQTDVVRLLLAHWANPNARNVKCKTALAIASGSSQDCGRILQDYADPDMEEEARQKARDLNRKNPMSKNKNDSKPLTAGRAARYYTNR